MRIWAFHLSPKAVFREFEEIVVIDTEYIADRGERPVPPQLDPRKSEIQRKMAANPCYQPTWDEVTAQNDAAIMDLVQEMKTR